MKNVFYLSGFGYNKRVEKKGKCEDNSMYISTKYLHDFLISEMRCFQVGRRYFV